MSAFVRRELPEFSWSNRRAETLAECPQAYYQRYYASHNGWEPGAPSEARDAWVLGKLTGLPQALGMALHRRAAECAAAIVAGDSLPAETELIARSRDELNALYVSSRDRRAFLANPKRSPMLHESYYRGTVSAEELERTREKLRVCTTNLVKSGVWAELRECRQNGGEVLVIDSLKMFEMDGVRIFAAPDLVYRTSEQSEFVVVDWKSGGWDGTLDALGVYGRLVRDSLGWPLVHGRCRGRVICLSTAEDHSFALEESDLSDAETRVRRSVAQMRSLLTDPVQNVSLPWDAYPLNWRPWRCKHCNYLQVCRSRIASGRKYATDDAD